MAYMNSGSGSLKLAVSKGSSLIIRNMSGSETVTGSIALREDAYASLGAGAVVYGPQPSDCEVTISTTGTLDYQVVAGDPTPAQDILKVNPITNTLDPASSAALAASGDGRGHQSGRFTTNEI